MSERKRGYVSFAEIRRTVPLVAVLEKYGVLGDLRRVGASLVGSCPIHKGTNRKQFTVDPIRQLWRCFSPEHDSGGDVLNFISEYENIGIREAANMIAHWFALASPSSSFSQHGKKRRPSMTDSNRMPTHKVYSAQKREGQKDFLTRIGSAWPFSTKDNKTGLNIQLSAMPISDRMVLFEYDAEEPEKPVDEVEKKPNGRRK